MKHTKDTDQRFQDLLEGRSAPASEDMDRMAKLASALAPTEVPGPSDQFRRRLRNELLAAAATSEEDMFAAMLDGSPMEGTEQVRQLVAVANALEPDALPQPAPAFRFQLRRTLMEQANVPARAGVAGKIAAADRRVRRSLRAIPAMAAAITMMVSSSAALAASGSALPGDALYGVKRIHESARLWVLTGEAEGVTRLELAGQRLVELQGLTARGTTEEDLYLGTLDTMDRLTTTGRDILVGVSEATSDLAPLQVVADFARRQSSGLSLLIDQLPPGVRPAALDSLSLAELVGQQAEAALGGCDCADAVFAPRSIGASAATCSCEAEVEQPGPQPSQNDDPRRGTEPDDSQPEPQDPPTVNLPDDLPDEVEEPAEDLLDDLLDQVEETLPPLPSPPPAPIPTPSVPGADSLGL